MNSCGTLGLSPRGALWLGEGGSHLAAGWLSGRLTGSWVSPVKRAAVSRLQALAAPGSPSPLVPRPRAQGGSHWPRGFSVARARVSSVAVIELSAPLSQPLLCSLSPLGRSPLGSQREQFPLHEQCPGPEGLSQPQELCPHLQKPALLPWLSLLGTILPWLGCLMLPGGVIQHLIPEQRAPEGELVSSSFSLQWSCTPHLPQRSSGSCTAHPRSCRPAATSRLSVLAMGTSASTTAGR